MSARLAVLGLGSMGGAIAERLCQDLSPALWNRSDNETLGRLAERGVRAPTPAAAAADADVVITCLTADDAVRDVILGADGVATTARAGSVVVDCSTVDPETARDVAARLAERGVLFVDAPVSGGPEAARRGSLTLMCGGSREAFAAARPVLELFGGKVLYLGAVGSGQVGKAVNQVILAGAFLGVAEGVTMAKRCGVDAETLIAGLREGAAASWVLSNRSDMMLSGDFTPKGRLALHHKDLLIAGRIAQAAGLTLPGAELVTELEGRAIEAGHGDDDVAAIITALD